GSKQQPREEVLTRRVEIGVGLGARISRSGCKMLGQLRGLDLISHIRKGIPPPRRVFRSDSLRIEDPYWPVLRPHVPRGIDQVALIRGGDHGPRRAYDSRDGPRGRLARARAPDVQMRIFP